MQLCERHERGRLGDLSRLWSVIVIAIDVRSVFLWREVTIFGNVGVCLCVFARRLLFKLSVYMNGVITGGKIVLKIQKPLT